MWMADESKDAKTSGGAIEMTGTIISNVQRNEPKSGGFFSGSAPEVWMFRIEDDRSGRPISVRFDGPVSGMVDQGDRVRIEGYMIKGILNARRISDEHGAVLAQAKCFVATTVYGSLWVPQVEMLRRFQGHYLEHHFLGRILVRLYWRHGPAIARKLEKRPFARHIVRLIVLDPVCIVLSVWMNPRSDKHSEQG
jgi:hypothetical protein